MCTHASCIVNTYIMVDYFNFFYKMTRRGKTIIYKQAMYFLQACKKDKKQINRTVYITTV